MNLNNFALYNVFSSILGLLYFGKDPNSGVLVDSAVFNSVS